MPLECLPSLSQAILILAGFFLLKYLIKRLLAKDHSKVQIHKTDWKKDVVYLYQFPRSPILPNLSPFCLKVETWLRANGIEYEVTSSYMMRSREGLVPFVELNGHHYADSQLIIEKLAKHFNTKDTRLSAEKRTLARALDRMIEGSLLFALACFRVNHSAETLKLGGLPVPEFVTNFLAIFMKRMYIARLTAQGMYKHDKKDIYEIMRRDLEALSLALGGQKFLLGDEIHEVDCTLFGHLAVSYCMPYDQPMKRLLQEDFTNLRDWLERVKETVYPDWNELTNGKQ